MRPPSRDWVVFGADRDTGAERAIRVRAVDAAAAEDVARGQRLLVAEVRPDGVEEAAVADAPPAADATPLQYANLTKQDQAWIAERPTDLGDEYRTILAGARFLDASAFVLRLVGLIGVGGGIAWAAVIGVAYARDGEGDPLVLLTTGGVVAALTGLWWLAFWLLSLAVRLAAGLARAVREIAVNTRPKL